MLGRRNPDWSCIVERAYSTCPARGPSAARDDEKAQLSNGQCKCVAASPKHNFEIADRGTPCALLAAFGGNAATPLSVDQLGGSKVVSLYPGKNFIGRDLRAEFLREPRLLEQGQWLIECEGQTASLCGDATTNHSALYRRGHPLPDPSTSPMSHTLGSGDVLASPYAYFVFDWLEARP